MNDDRTGRHREAGDSFVPGLKTEEGRRAVADVHAYRRAEPHTTRSSSRVVTVIMLLFIAGVYYWSRQETPSRHPDSILGPWPVQFFLSLATLPLLASGFGVRPSYVLAQGGYYALPGTRDAQGEHRCFACGHRGIHRRGRHKSPRTYADCSKCGTNLWVSG